MRNRALRGAVKVACLPVKTTLCIFNDDWLSKNELIHKRTPDLPANYEQFFSFEGDQNWSAWMQTKGEYFWCFNRGGDDDIKLYKVEGARRGYN